jgi:hypothetical protein
LCSLGMSFYVRGLTTMIADLCTARKNFQFFSSSVSPHMPLL